MIQLLEFCLGCMRTAGEGAIGLFLFFMIGVFLLLFRKIIKGKPEPMSNR